MNTYRKSFMKKESPGKFLKPLAIIFFVAISYTYATGQVLNITVPLSPAQETSLPVPSTATGTGNLTFDTATNTLSGTATFSGLTSLSTAGHIHQAPAGVPGPVIIPIDALGGVGVLAGTMTMSPTVLTPAQLAAFNNNDLYINIHSANNSGGEIRGQIIPNGTFSDVPQSGFAFAQIEAIAGAGITGGCAANPPRYCPNNTITRGQMAVFLEVSAGRGAPVACTGTRFTDVTPASVGQAACDFIEAFANAGITGGCGLGIFCPNDPVTRGQMAVFIETAIGGVTTPCAGTFTDVLTTHPFCGFIELLNRDGITGGCGGTNFCPNDPVTRAQMAVFLDTAPILLP